jgi:hypothetical protein
MLLVVLHVRAGQAAVGETASRLHQQILNCPRIRLIGRIHADLHMISSAQVSRIRPLPGQSLP